MSSEIIKEFLVAIGFAADERSAKLTEERINRVEQTARKADQARTKTAGEESMNRARDALKAEGVQNTSATRIHAKMREMAKAEAELGKGREQRIVKEIRGNTRAVVGYQVLRDAAKAFVAVQRDVTNFVETLTERLEALAYSSDRTKSSVLSLRTFASAVSHLGGSAGGALNDLENFASRLRSNPQGYTAFLKSVGVEARDAKGNIRGAAELYKEFRKNVAAQKPYEEQLLYAHEMGISEQTWRATDPAKLAEEEAKSKARYARMGHDPDKAAEEAKELQNTFRDMWETVAVIGEKALSKIFKDIGGNLREFTTFLEQHGDQIADMFSKVAQAVLAVSRALLEIATSERVKGFVDWLLSSFGKIDESNGKWLADTEKIKTALEALAAFVATVFLAKIVAGVAGAVKVLGPLLTMLAPFLAMTGLAAVANSQGILAGPGDSRSLGEGALRTLDPGLADRVYGKTTEDQAADKKDSRSLLRRGWDGAKSLFGIGGASATSAGSARPIGKLARNENAAAIMDELRQGGYNNNAIAATVGSMQTESSFNPRAHNGVKGGHTGLWQWDSTRWPKVEKWIRSQGGDPYDARWQTKAWMAEHNAKPGDPMYDTGRTAKGGQILRSNPTLDEAIHGVRESERFGAGEEGGRAANARQWLPIVEKPPAPPAPAPSPAGTLPNGAPRVLKPDSMPDAPGVTMREHLAGRAKEAVDRFNGSEGGLDKDKLRSFGNATQNFDPKSFFTVPPAGTQNTTSNSTSSNSFTGGTTHITLNNHGSPAEGSEILKRHKDRQMADETRYAANIFA